MTIACCLFFFMVILLVGFALTALILRGAEGYNPLEACCLILPLGLGGTGLVLFWLSLAGFKPSGVVLSLISALAAVGLVYMGRKGWLALFSFTADDSEIQVLKRRLWFTVPCVAAAAATFLVVCGDAFLMPLYMIDSFVIWNLKAKVLFHDAILSNPYFHELPLSFSHLDYPMLVPFLVSGVYAALGYTDDVVGKSVHPVIYVAFVGLSYVALRWRNAPAPSLILAAIVATLPPVVQWSASGTADMPLTLFYLGSVYYMARVFDKDGCRSADIALGALFATFCAFCKNEGMALALISIVIFTGFSFIRGRGGRETAMTVARYVVLLGLLLAPWVVFNHFLPQTYENYPARLNLETFQANMSRMPAVVAEFSLCVSNFWRWGLFWILFAVSACVGWRAITLRPAQVLWTLFVAHILLYWFVFVVSPFEPHHLATMSLERLLLHAVPAALLIISCNCGKIFPPTT